MPHLKHNTDCRGLFFSEKRSPTFTRRFLPEKKLCSASSKATTRFLRIYEFSSSILWKFSRAIWSYCDVMFTKRKPDSEKNKNTFMCKMDYFMTMVDIGFKMQPNPRRKHTLESKIHPVECFDRQCKIAVEKFKSCSSQAEYL